MGRAMCSQAPQQCKVHSLCVNRSGIQIDERDHQPTLRTIPGYPQILLPVAARLHENTLSRVKPNAARASDCSRSVSSPHVTQLKSQIVSGGNAASGCCATYIKSSTAKSFSSAGWRTILYRPSMV
jgi:hypothetical protein